MFNRIKEYLYVAIIIALLIGAYTAVRFVSAYANSIEPSSFRSFSVTGEGKITSIPDIAQFNFSVITQGNKDIAKIQKDNTDKVNKAVAFLKSQNIEEKDIKTENYNLEPRYQYYNCNQPYSSVSPCPPAEIVGYTITQSVSIKIRDFSKIGDTLSGIIKNGANSVSQLSFTIDNPESVKIQARENAIKNAKEKAGQIAKAGGFSVGRLIAIEEIGTAPDYRYLKGMGMGGDMATSEAAPIPAIQPGSQEVTVNIVLRYEIK